MIDNGFQNSNSQDDHVLFHYCDFFDEERDQAATMIVRGLLRQKLELEEEWPQEVAALHDLYSRSRTEPTLGELTTLLITVALDSRKEVTIVVDALDECMDRETLIAALGCLAKHFQIFLTSRPFIESHHSLSGTVLGVQAANSDIHTFVQRKISINEDLRSLLSDRLREEVVLKIVSRAQGV